MHLTWLGHSCVLLSGTQKVLIDPFVPEGSVASTCPDIVAVTHGHHDHLGEVVALGKTVVAISEIARYLEARGVPAEGMNLGGTITVGGVSFTMTPAVHSAGIDSAAGNLPGGAAAGYVIRMDGVSVYHAGDTALFSDMKLIGELYHPDIALLPIGGRYTMGTREAMMAANFIGAKTVIPIHYNTWDRIAADPVPFKTALERTTDLTVKILSPGESIEVTPS
ncbi:metal-dependent hydrolase [Methanoregula sp.]|jgi:L-ascorbate metabolism protein UlaG (beta-lactamase superfamily)|uniref:metal-dependent hydrolase n=1 Tax=Methanoregula sp. TaxID=2052170 RepID=UPI0025E843ED|nr:metal-dependent hydrolase [Methanoregula sp.]